MEKQLPDELIKPIITVDEQVIEYQIGQYCWFGTNSEQGICGDPPHPDIFNEQIKDDAITLNPDSKIEVKFSIKPEKLIFVRNNPDGTQEQISSNGRKYSLPRSPGYYQYELSAEWDEKNTASYHFGIIIVE
ncbi:hypothetical protein [Paenibacillus marinisediminis]